MTNEELKNIIARHVCNACEFGHGFDGKCDLDNDYRKCSICGETAEALIKAGIGDVRESKNEVIAAKLVAQAAANANIERIEEWKHRAVVAEMELRRKRNDER